MVDLCPTCHRPFRVLDSEDPDADATTCPRGPFEIADHPENPTPGSIACAMLGLALRDQQLAATKALNDRSLLALIQLRDKIDLAIAGTQQEVEEVDRG